MTAYRLRSRPLSLKTAERRLPHTGGLICVIEDGEPCLTAGGAPWGAQPAERLHLITMCLECGTTFTDIVRHLRRRQIVRDALTAGFAIAPPAVKHSQAPSAPLRSTPLSIWLSAILTTPRLHPKQQYYGWFLLLTMSNNPFPNFTSKSTISWWQKNVEKCQIVSVFLVLSQNYHIPRKRCRPLSST